jgi:hypothetical protein
VFAIVAYLLIQNPRQLDVHAEEADKRRCFSNPIDNFLNNKQEKKPKNGQAADSLCKDQISKIDDDSFRLPDARLRFERDCLEKYFPTIKMKIGKTKLQENTLSWQ